MYNLQRLGVHRWQPEWLTYYRMSGLWSVVAEQQYREYTLGRPTRIN